MSLTIFKGFHPAKLPRHTEDINAKYSWFGEGFLAVSLHVFSRKIGMWDAEILQLTCIPGTIMLFHEDCQVYTHNDKRKWYCAAVQQKRKQKTDESSVQLTHQKLSLSLDILPHIPELFIIFSCVITLQVLVTTAGANLKSTFFEIHELKQSDKCNSMY